MFTRRIVACACALALAVPAAASARAGFDPPTQTTSHTVYGDTKYDLQNQQDLASPKGDVANVYVPPKGDTKDDLVLPAGKGGVAVASLSQAQLAAAYGGSGPLHPAKVAAPTDDGTDGWRIAAVAEAGLLAAFALGAATFVGRMRPRRGATT
jgi:hypothetical protein